MSDCVIGVDTGGTFTDVVVIDETGEVASAKAPTTPHDLSAGVLAGVARVAATLGLTHAQLLARARVLRLSGTTATNALLVRAGDPVGMLTTAGFEDTLLIGRAVSAWAGLTERETRRMFHQHKAEPLVLRDRIRGIQERIDADGRIVAALDSDEVARAARELAGDGVSSIAVCFMWSVRNAAHEDAAARIVAETCPGLPVHCSHDVAAALGEYERFATTVVDAYVSPVLTRFLDGFEGQLRGEGFAGELLVAQADGGCLRPRAARPVSTLHSGPVAGVMASALEGARLGLRDIVATDVGGTSFDVGLVADGQWIHARQPELGGFNLSIPMIEVASVGAGGGSIVWVDELGVLHVGPRSAGAVPGPACYGAGGTQATVTDADLVLGYLAPGTELGGRPALSSELATRAITPLADALGLDVLATAAGIFQIANAHMGDLLVRQIVARGRDPRDFVIYAYGGAGPMHCAFYAAECGVEEVVIPARAGTFSALGVAVAPILHTARAVAHEAMPMDPVRFTTQMSELTQHVEAELERDGVAEPHRTVSHLVEMRYGAQVHTVRLEVSGHAPYDESDLSAICAMFDDSYERLYGQGSGYPEAGRFLTTFIVEGRGATATTGAHPTVAPIEDAAPTHAMLGTREAYFDGAFTPSEVYRYERLRAGDVVAGPAVVEADQTTVVVPPGTRAVLDAVGNLRLTGLQTLADPTQIATGQPA